MSEQIKNETIQESLKVEMRRELEYISNLEPGTDLHTDAVENLTKLYKIMDRENQSTSDVKDKNIDRGIKIGLGLTELMVPLAFYSIWMRRGFEFEKEGAYSSRTFMELFKRFKPTK